MLTKCPECGHDVSTNAEKCPNCGAPIGKLASEKANNLKKKFNIWDEKTWYPEKICTECGYIGYSVSITPGNFFTELLLWLCFLLPGLIYSIWRLSGRHNGCPKCGGKMIALNSPRGRKLYEELEEEIYIETPSYKNKIPSNDGNIPNQKEQLSKITNRTEGISDKSDGVAQESITSYYDKLTREIEDKNVKVVQKRTENWFKKIQEKFIGWWKKD